MSNIVLGHHPGYILLADKLGARRFSVPAWIWVKLPQADQWRMNLSYLQRAIIKRDQFVLCPIPAFVRPGSTYARELLFIAQNGVRLFNPSNVVYVV